MQLIDLDRTPADQLQVRQRPGRRVGQDRQRGGHPWSWSATATVNPGDPGRTLPLTVSDQVQKQPLPESHPHGDGSGGPPLGAEQ
jgi:hypothetical protein